MIPTLLLAMTTLAAPPPPWAGRQFLHAPILKGCVTESGIGDELSEAIASLADAAPKRLSSASSAMGVHNAYRKAVFGEHIVVQPERQHAPDLPLQIIVGFERDRETQACKLTGVFTLDADGRLNQLTDYDRSRLGSFESRLKQHFLTSIQRVKAARRAIELREAAERE